MERVWGFWSLAIRANFWATSSGNGPASVGEGSAAVSTSSVVSDGGG